jgi:hypothetical protein
MRGLGFTIVATPYTERSFAVVFTALRHCSVRAPYHVDPTAEGEQKTSEGKRLADILGARFPSLGKKLVREALRNYVVYVSIE